MPELFETYDDLDDAGGRLQAADPGERRGAVLQRGASGGPPPGERLGFVVAGPPQRGVARGAADSMAELKDPASADAIFPLVAHAHAFVRMAALRALKELRRKDALKLALDALRDTDASVRVQAVGVIGFLKLEEAVPALTAATTHRDSHVRPGAGNPLAFSNMNTPGESVLYPPHDHHLIAPAGPPPTPPPTKT